MNMRDAETGQLMWQSRNWDEEIFEREEEGTQLLAMITANAFQRIFQLLFLSVMRCHEKSTFHPVMKFITSGCLLIL